MLRTLEKLIHFHRTVLLLNMLDLFSLILDFVLRQCVFVRYSEYQSEFSALLKDFPRYVSHNRPENVALGRNI